MIWLPWIRIRIEKTDSGSRTFKVAYNAEKITDFKLQRACKAEKVSDFNLHRALIILLER